MISSQSSEDQFDTFVANHVRRSFAEDPPNLKNSICFLLDVSLAKQELGELKIDINKENPFTSIVLSTLISFGEFHTIRGHGYRPDSIVLNGSSNMRGEVFLCIGPYVGAQKFAVEALSKKYGEAPSRAAKSIMRAHCQENMEIDNTEALFSHLTPESVNKHLARLGIELSPDQRKYVKEILDKNICESVAGSGKTTLAAAI